VTDALMAASPTGANEASRTSPVISTSSPTAAVSGRFTDTGSGMTPQVMSHIFDPLYTTKDRGQGTGLGLVIVNQVVTELGGTVEVESNLGRGTRFRLTFPAIPNDVPLVVEQQEHAMQPGV